MRAFYLPWLLCGGLCSFGLTAMAQLGVAPSQTSRFLDELRERVGEERKDPLGEDRAVLERGRDLGRPDFLSASQATAERLRSDLTDYAGQYQASRKFLTPFSQGVEAPERTLKGVAGLEWGMTLEQNVEFNRYQFEQPAFPLFLFDANRESLLSQTLLSIDGKAGSLEDGRLTFGVGLGMTYALTDDLFLQNSDDHWAGEVLPGSSIAYDVQLGPVLVTVYDRVSVRSSAGIGGPRVQSIGSFGVRQNDAGVAATWRIDEKWNATLNYNWALSRAHNRAFRSYGNRSIQSVSAQITYAGGQSWKAGLEGGYAWSDVDGINYDGEEWHAGVFFQTSMGAAHEVRAAVGFQAMDFRSSPLLWAIIGPGFLPVFFTTGDYSTLQSPYYHVTLTGRLHERVSHELEVGYGSSLGLTTNFVSAHYANYGITIRPWEGGHLTTSGYVEFAKDSGGVFAGDSFGWGLDVAFEQQIGAKWRVGAAYHYGYSDVAASQFWFNVVTPSEYYQHGAAVTCAYQISKRWSATVSAQSFVHQPAFGNALDFRQDRVIAGVRVEF